METITQQPELEHDYYRLGERSFQQVTDDNKTNAPIQAKWGDPWKRLRYHHLVRLGGDVLRSGLADYAPATVLGALLYQANMRP